MSELNIDSFGKIIDRFLEENTIHMMLTLPEGTLDVQVQDNTGMGSVVQFYILLNSIQPIFDSMVNDMGIDENSTEFEKMVDALLGIVKKEIIGTKRKGGS